MKKVMGNILIGILSAPFWVLVWPACVTFYGLLWLVDEDRESIGKGFMCLICGMVVNFGYWFLLAWLFETVVFGGT